MDTATIERRLRRLETAQRRWRAAACLAALALISVVTMGQAQEAPSEVRARRFVLVGDDGMQQAVLADGKLTVGPADDFHAVLGPASLDLSNGERKITSMHTLGFESVGGSMPDQEIRFAMEIGFREAELTLGGESGGVRLHAHRDAGGALHATRAGKTIWTSER